MRTPETWDNDIDGATWGEVTCHQFQQSQQPLLRQRCQRCVHVVFLLSLVRLIRHFFFLSLSLRRYHVRFYGRFSLAGDDILFPWRKQMTFLRCLVLCAVWPLATAVSEKTTRESSDLGKEGGRVKKKTFRGLLLTRTARRLSAVCIDLKQPTGKLAGCRQQHTGGGGCGHCGQTVCVHFSYLST